ncbi:MAG: methyl-accepting chemotaxis protein [Lachnospiraceae bacterium]|nr:methyl-accepting chemotaxis protein [Lachnospiraceae bacterium]
MSDKKRLTMGSMLMMFSMIPLVATVLILGIVCSQVMKKNIEANIREELQVAAKSLREYYEYDLINDMNLVDGFCEYDTDFVDSMGTTGVDLTLFKDNVRFVTTIKDNTGKRIEGTEASPAVWAAVSKGEDYYSDDVVINGIDYYVYYMPLGQDKIYGMAFAGKPADDIKAAERTLFVSVFGVGIGLCLLFAILVLLIARKVSRPLKTMAVAVEEIADGNLQADLQARSHVAETVMLLTGTDRLTDTLKRIMTGITDKVQNLTASSQQLSAASNENADNIARFTQTMEEITNGATNQAEEVQTAAASVSDVMNNLDKINRAVESTENATNMMTEDSGRVVDDFDTLIKDTYESIQKLQEITEKMNAVTTAVEDVNNAAGEINNIASQTNLLSLNASIEAARAGEAGRGFSVVAGEISNLSEQSDKAARAIKDIMINLEAETNDAVQMVSSLSEVMKKQEETSKKSQQSLSDLMNAIDQTKQEVELVKDGSGEVSVICERLNEIIQNLSAISEENAASAQESTSTIGQVRDNTENVMDMAGDLKDIADSLSELISYFR